MVRGDFITDFNGDLCFDVLRERRVLWWFSDVWSTHDFNFLMSLLAG